MSTPTEITPRWAPSPFLYASAALHMGAAAVTLWSPPLWPWTLSALALNHAALTGAGLWPKSRWLGRIGLVRPRPAARDGKSPSPSMMGRIPKVTPRVLALLGAYGARATFFCVGERVQRHPALVREIVRLGHAVENHSQLHRHTFSLMGPRAIEREIATAQRTIAGVTGQRPLFFRAPAGLRNPFLDPVLSRLGLQLATWTHRGFDTVNGDCEQVYRRLTRSLEPGDILLLHDGHAARGSLGTPVIVEVLPRLLEALKGRRLEPVTLRAAAA